MLNQHMQTIVRNFVATSSSSINYETDIITINGSPDNTVTSFPSTIPGITNHWDTLIAIDANIGASDNGLLIEFGGSGGTGIAVGVDSGTMRARAYNGARSWGNFRTSTSHLEVSISSYTGSDATYYMKVDDSLREMSLYVQPGGIGSASSIVSLGSDTATGSSAVNGSAGSGFGTQNSSVADLGSTYEATFTGTIDEIRYWFADSAQDVSSFPTATTTGGGGGSDSAGFALASGSANSAGFTL